MASAAPYRGAMELDPAVACAALLAQDHVGASTVAALWRAYGSFGEVAQAAAQGEDLAVDVASATRRRVVAVRAAFTAASLRRAEARVRSWRASHDGLLALGEEAYPPSLAALHDPPPLLFVRGRLPESVMGQAGRARAVAVVGTRSATPWALGFAEMCAYDLTRAGIVVVSGLALGIDGAAHRGALEASGSGASPAAEAATVAVLAGGLDRPHPPSHAGLARRIAGQGALLSEHPPGAEPTRGAFPRRNRIVAGLARAVLVVEAPFRSGVRHTVATAANEGRELWVVPQRPDGLAGRAACQLMRDGAMPLGSAADIVEAWDGAEKRPTAQPAPPRDPLQRTVLSALETGGAATLDALAPAGHSLAAVMAAFTALERSGRIRRGVGGLWHPVDGSVAPSRP